MITHKTADGYEIKVDCNFQNHTEAFSKLIEMMTKGDGAVIENISEIDAIGHRVAQGADKFPHSCLLTEEVVQQIADLSELAPLHNPAHICLLYTSRCV